MKSNMKHTLDLFEKELLRQQKSANTIRAYTQDAREFMNWFTETIGNFSPEQVTAIDIKEFKGYLYNVKNNKPATVNRKLTALEQFCNVFVELGKIKNNPAAGVQKIKYQKQSQAFALESKDLYKIKRMFYLEGNRRNIAIFELMINTGLREAEVCNLRLDDIVISERKGTAIIRSGKGDKYREVPLNADVRKAITDYLETRPNRGNYLFVSNKSDRLSESQLYRIVRKHADMAGVEAYPHILRYTFATKLLREKNVDLVTVKELLGHASINTTAIYTRANRHDLEKAVEKLET